MATPQKIDLRRMYNAFTKIGGSDRTKYHYFSNDLGIVDAVDILRPFIIDKKGPYLIEDYRLVVCKKGYIRTIINLQEQVIKEGMMVIVVPGSIIEPIAISDDFTVTGIGVSEDRLQLALQQQMPDILGSLRNNVFLPVVESEQQLIEQLSFTILNLASNRTIGRASIDSMLCVLTHTFDDIVRSYAKGASFHANAHNRQHEIFQDFINLVNKHCCSERQLDYYADRLCITKRHLGSVVHEASGVTAKEWIDRATITVAKVMLCYSDRSVSQIAEEMHFQNDSFFCKYFKRLTGCTPLKWRNEA